MLGRISIFQRLLGDSVDLVEIIDILEDDLVRDCIVYKSSEHMQKTINYSDTSNFTVNINNRSYENISQALFLTENNIVNLYLISNNDSNIIFPLNQINTLEVET